MSQAQVDKLATRYDLQLVGGDIIAHIAGRNVVLGTHVQGAPVLNDRGLALATETETDEVADVIAAARAETAAPPKKTRGKAKPADPAVPEVVVPDDMVRVWDDEQGEMILRPRAEVEAEVALAEAEAALNADFGE